jgi:hypothetical protein
MKKVTVLLSILGLMSFTNYKPLQDQIKIVLLTTSDWKTLEKISIKGKTTISVVNFKTRLNVVSTVQYQNADIEISKEQRKKLNEILKKYE